MTTDLTIEGALERAISILDGVSDSPRLDAELLLVRAIDVTRAYLIAHPEDTLDPEAEKRFFDAVERRGQREPLAYITGRREFWSLDLMVSPATLVPRPETELLVEQTLTLLPRRAPGRVLDLGTGSGAVALAIACERRLCDVVATDVSEAALAIARENARQLDIDNVSFRLGDWAEPVAGERFDVVVSNPPYVRSDDPVLANLGHEPLEALAAGEDGLDAIRRIAEQAVGVIAAGGTLMIEHGAGQEADVARILQANGWLEIRCFHDLAGLPRVTQARR